MENIREKLKNICTKLGLNVEDYEIEQEEVRKVPTKLDQLIQKLQDYIKKTENPRTLTRTLKHEQETHELGTSLLTTLDEFIRENKEITFNAAKAKNHVVTIKQAIAYIVAQLSYISSNNKLTNEEIEHLKSSLNTIILEQEKQISEKRRFKALEARWSRIPRESKLFSRNPEEFKTAFEEMKKEYFKTSGKTLSICNRLINLYCPNNDLITKYLQNGNYDLAFNTISRWRIPLFVADTKDYSGLFDQEKSLFYGLDDITKRSTAIVESKLTTIINYLQSLDTENMAQDKESISSNEYPANKANKLLEILEKMTNLNNTTIEAKKDQRVALEAILGYPGVQDKFNELTALIKSLNSSKTFYQIESYQLRDSINIDAIKETLSKHLDNANYGESFEEIMALINIILNNIELLSHSFNEVTWVPLTIESPIYICDKSNLENYLLSLYKEVYGQIKKPEHIIQPMFKEHFKGLHQVIELMDRFESNDNRSFDSKARTISEMLNYGLSSNNKILINIAKSIKNIITNWEIPIFGLINDSTDKANQLKEIFARTILVRIDTIASEEKETLVKCNNVIETLKINEESTPGIKLKKGNGQQN